ncbi:MAG: hypothetical protein GY751_14570 [Bacteroidetes bacterium]|nr:hypothetical protein [Bacteroidota bacterium]
MKKSKLEWIRSGYSLFAKEGKSALNVDKIAKLVGKSRSCFYHNFYDLKDFRDQLFCYHYEQAKKFQKNSILIDELIPEFIQLMFEYKDWVFFQKQIFLLRFEDAMYLETFDKIRSVTEGHTASLWIKTAGLEKLPVSQIRQFFFVIRETLYTRFDYNNWTEEVIIKEITEINNSFKFLINTDLNKAG